MHHHAHQWVTRYAHLGRNAHIVDVGGRNVNGTVRDLFPTAASYTAVDLRGGLGVDVQADFLHYSNTEGPDGLVDLVLHLETAEHTAEWPEHMAHAAGLLRPDGALIVTCAGPGRIPHSAVDGGTLRDGETYDNVHPEALAQVLRAEFAHVVIRSGPGMAQALGNPRLPGDVYAVARR